MHTITCCRLIAAVRDDLVEARFQVKRIAVAAIRYPGKHLLVEAEEDQHLAISPMEYDRQPILRHIDSLNPAWWTVHAVSPPSTGSLCSGPAETTTPNPFQAKQGHAVPRSLGVCMAG